jgi:hypothetical protein
VAFLGTCIGPGVGLSTLRLTLIVALLFPGLPVGFVVARIFGIAAGVVACSVSNGVAYGLLMYGWDRLINAVI